MTIFRSERIAAFILLAAAALGLVAANSGIGPAVIRFQATHLTMPGTPFDLSVGHWVSDGLLALFFFVVAVELKHELTVGQLNSPARAVRPAIAALGGIVVPIAVYLAVAGGSGYSRGWPIPTATDIAFALGVLAVFGRGIPGRLRVFLLALAILDDIVAIVIIAVFFTRDPNLGTLAVAALGVAAFAVLSRFLGTRARVPVAIGMVAAALVAWGFVYLSGVHATIAGVALGLAMASRPGMRVRHALEPLTNGIVLPLFAFSAALVVLPRVGLGGLSAPFWGILVALPVGKLVGIAAGGWLSGFVGPRESRSQLTLLNLATVGALGGIGFTVSLLMNELAFAEAPEVAAEGTIAVLLGSVFAIVLSAILVSAQASYYRRLRALRASVIRDRDAPDSSR
ncbi:MAG: Na+/H+ antiporter NhaA [Microbacteriaceae bacterium]|nr:Na+/H+ antiporter NhaA [Microbacteriaceae bacterium]